MKDTGGMRSSCGSYERLSQGSWGANFSYYSDRLKSEQLLSADQNTAEGL